jgi:acyl carrier protein
LDTKQLLDQLDEFIRTDILRNQRKESISPDEDLIQSAIIDSLGFVNLLSFISREYNIEFEEDELVPEKFVTLSAIAENIQQKMS